MGAQPTLIAFSEYLVEGYSDERMFFYADVAIAFVMLKLHSPNRTAAYACK